MQESFGWPVNYVRVILSVLLVDPPCESFGIIIAPIISILGRGRLNSHLTS